MNKYKYFLEKYNYENADTSDIFVWRQDIETGTYEYKTVNAKLSDDNKWRTFSPKAFELVEIDKEEAEMWLLK